MHSFSLTTAVLLPAILAPCATAQITSPRGYFSAEGDSSLASFGSPQRVMAIDQTSVGSPLTIGAIEFRKDGRNTSTRATARTLDMTLRLGYANVATLYGEFDRNYVGTPTVVHAKKTINFPDWTSPTANPPARFDFQIFLDTPYPYDGSSAMIWDMTIENSSNTARIHTDMQWEAFAQTGGIPLGTGCVSTGRIGKYTHTMALRDGGPPMGAMGMHMLLSTTGAPTFASVFMNIAFRDSNLPIPGVCTNLRAQPMISFDVGTSDQNGRIRDIALSFPYMSQVVGVTLVTQFLSFDSGQSGIMVSLSNAARTTMPAPKTGALSERGAYIQALATAKFGRIQFGGTPIINLK